MQPANEHEFVEPGKGTYPDKREGFADLYAALPIIRLTAGARTFPTVQDGNHFATERILPAPNDRNSHILVEDSFKFSMDRKDPRPPTPGCDIIQIELAERTAWKTGGKEMLVNGTDSKKQAPSCPSNPPWPRIPGTDLDHVGSCQEICVHREKVTSHN